MSKISHFSAPGRCCEFLCLNQVSTALRKSPSMEAVTHRPGSDFMMILSDLMVIYGDEMVIYVDLW